MLGISVMLSAQCAKGSAAKTKKACTAETTKTAFADATKQAGFESPDFLLIDGSSVKASVPPVVITPRILGAAAGGQEVYLDDPAPEDSQKSIIEYVVGSDDTIASLAEKFGVSAASILWANDLAKGSTLKTGQQLIIPPVSGIIHYVVSGDTVAQVANKYSVKSSDVISFNELAGENDLFVGDVLVVPGGVMPKKVAASTAPKPGANASAGLSLPGDYFLCPIPLAGGTCKKTQGTHFRNAVDLSNGRCGDPVYAAASGVVQRVRASGWNGGAGNTIDILHPSGAITHYYHLQTIFVTTGQAVVKGQNIALMGTTGRSTGCHLHFEIIGAVNPFVK